MNPAVLMLGFNYLKTTPNTRKMQDGSLTLASGSKALALQYAAQILAADIA